jgi:hypothetical protein
MANEKRDAPASSQYTVIRSQIDQQHNTSNQRIFWLILSQSFFINAFVMMITAQQSQGKEAIYRVMLNIIPLASILTIIFTYVDVIGSIMYVEKLRKHYEDININDPETGQFPPIAGDKTDRIFSRISPLLIPITFIIIWIVMWATEG